MARYVTLVVGNFDLMSTFYVLIILSFHEELSTAMRFRYVGNMLRRLTNLHRADI